MTVKLTKKVPRSACRLNDSDGITFTMLADEGADPKAAEVARRWSMLAHTGKVVSRYWGRLVLDMDGATYRQKLALLKDHNAAEPIGYSQKVERTKRGIEASGRMLSTELADQVIAISREGFPWQASLMAVPTHVEELEPGATAEVNGRTVTGPLTIFRQWEMHELTLTTLGADDNTTTEAFAASGEIEVETMVIKTKDAPATQPADPTAQVPTPQPVAPAINPTPTAPDGTQLERARVASILQAADPSQHELAHQHIASGTPLSEALSAIAKDLKERLQAAQQNLRVAAEPIGGGNTAAHVEANRAAAGGVNFSALESAEHEPESLTAEWKKNANLRGFFQSDKQFLAWHKNRHRAMHMGSDLQIELLAGGLKALGYRNVQGTYFHGYEEAMALSFVSRIAMGMTTDQAMEVYKWLGNVPSPNKWTGERQRRGLTDYGVTVIGDKYELTVDCDVDDLRRDKTGQILRRIADIGRKTATLPELLVTQFLEANGTAYDGLSLYNANHTVGRSGVQSNDRTFAGLGTPDAPTSAGMSGAILGAVQALYSLKDDQGDPMNTPAKRFLLMVPTKYWAPTVAALQNEFTSAGVSNTLLNAGVQITPVVNPRLNESAAAAGRRCYLFREDADVLALIQQDEDVPDGFKSEDAYSHNGFWKDRVSWGSKRIVTIAPGLFELTLRMNLAT